MVSYVKINGLPIEKVSSHMRRVSRFLYKRVVCVIQRAKSARFTIFLIHTTRRHTHSVCVCANVVCIKLELLYHVCVVCACDSCDTTCGIVCHCVYKLKIRYVWCDDVVSPVLALCKLIKKHHYRHVTLSRTRDVEAFRIRVVHSIPYYWFTEN